MRLGVTLVTLASGLVLAPRVAVADEKDSCASAAEAAQSLQRRGRLLDARAQALACTRPACPAVVKQDCDALFASLEVTLPSLVLATRDETGHDILGATVKIDGTVVDASNGQAIRVDPGVHTVQVTAPGRLTTEQKIAVHEGERARPVTMTLLSKDAPPRPSTPPRPRELSPFVWILGTLSAVSLVGFAVFQIEAVSDSTHLKHTCAPRCAQTDADSVKTESLLGWVSGAAAVGFAGGAIAVWQLGKEPESPTVGVNLGPARVGVVGRF